MDCFVATILFGSTPQLKVVMANNQDNAVKVVFDTYPTCDLASLFSLTDLENTLRLCENPNIHFVHETIVGKKDIQTKVHVETNKTLEEIEAKYQSKNCVIFDANSMKTSIGVTLHWLNTKAQEIMPLIDPEIEREFEQERTPSTKGFSH